MRRSQPIKRNGQPKKRNPKRSSRAFAHSYLNQHRVAFVKAQRCTVPFCSEGPCDNAHVGGVAGMGMKGPYTEIAPLCRRHHTEWDVYGESWFVGEYGISRMLLLQAAEAVEISYRAFCGEYDV